MSCHDCGFDIMGLEGEGCVEMENSGEGYTCFNLLELDVCKRTLSTCRYAIAQRHVSISPPIQSICLSGSLVDYQELFGNFAKGMSVTAYRQYRRTSIQIWRYFSRWNSPLIHKN